MDVHDLNYVFHVCDAGVRTLGCADLFRVMAFAQLTWGIAVMAPADLVRDKTAPPVEGSMPPLTALDRLFEGSGLKYSHNADGALTIAPAGSTKAIERKPAVPRAEVAPNLRVTASFSGRRSTTRQIQQNALANHFSAAVSPGSAASFGPLLGKALLSGLAVGITRNGTIVGEGKGDQSHGL
jgi:hypothetical protein